MVACPVIFQSILLSFLAEDGAGGAVLLTSLLPVAAMEANKRAAAGVQVQGLCKQIQPEHGQGFAATSKRHCQTDTATGRRTLENPSGLRLYIP